MSFIVLRVYSLIYYIYTFITPLIPFYLLFLTQYNSLPVLNIREAS
jgi:hypothetical protein